MLGDKLRVPNSRNCHIPQHTRCAPTLRTGYISLDMQWICGDEEKTGGKEGGRSRMLGSSHPAHRVGPVSLAVRGCNKIRRGTRYAHYRRHERWGWQGQHDYITKPRPEPPALAFQNPRPGQSRPQAVSLARPGLA